MVLARRAYCCAAAFSPLITAQRFSREIGLRSSIHTVSPVLNSFFSSCAWYFFERRIVFFISGCVKRRSTRTTTVLSCLSLTTTPCNVRFGIRYSLLFAASVCFFAPALLALVLRLFADCGFFDLSDF